MLRTLFSLSLDDEVGNELRVKRRQRSDRNEWREEEEEKRKEY